MKIWLLDKNINITSNESYRFYKEAINSGIEYEFIAVDDFDVIIASEPFSIIHILDNPTRESIA